MSARLIAPLFYALCFIIGILLLINSFSAEYSSVNGRESMLYPQVIISGWILFSLAALIEDFIKKTELDKGNWRALGLAILSVTFLFLTLVPLGFVTSGFLFFCMYAFALGYKKPMIIIVSAIATTGTLWWLFEVFFRNSFTYWHIFFLTGDIMDIQMLSSAFDLAFAPSVLLLVVIGVFWGTLIGALPGLGSIIAITMILPFTYKLSSVGALSLIMGVYCGAVYGGCISAILLNTPGTPQSAATCFDGFPMAKQGKAGEAIGWATISSTIGGLFSCVVLVLVGPKLASFAQNFGPIETFALIVMALTCISGVSQGSIFKGLMAGCIGLFLGVIGSDPMSGDLRFTFGNFQLNGGVNLIAVVIGVFSLTEVLFRAFEGNEDGSNLVRYSGMRFPKMAQWKGRVGTLIKSCLIGTGVGILPGTGGATASFISYAEAKRSSPFKDNFGKGEPAGIIAPESSNNAVTGGALIPTLALGIPGDPVTAVMMVTLVIHGMTPGVRLMRDNPETVMATFVLLFIANLLLIPVGMLISKAFAKILYLPEILLMAGVVLLCTLGVYADSNNYFHLRIALACGIVGSAMRYLKIPIAPLVIGLVLSNQLEVSLRQGLLLSNNNPIYFLHSPIAVLLFLLAIIILIMPIIQNIKSNRIKAVNKN